MLSLYDIVVFRSVPALFGIPSKPLFGIPSPCLTNKGSGRARTPPCLMSEIYTRTCGMIHGVFFVLVKEKCFGPGVSYFCSDTGNFLWTYQATDLPSSVPPRPHPSHPVRYVTSRAACCVTKVVRRTSPRAGELYPRKRQGRYPRGAGKAGEQKYETKKKWAKKIRV